MTQSIVESHLLNAVRVSLGVARHADAEVVAMLLANVLHLDNTNEEKMHWRHERGDGRARGGGDMAEADPFMSSSDGISS